jgi:Uncharacterized conserved protein (COG2071).
MTARLLDCLVLTYAVPADRARAHLPEGLAPDLLPGPDGEPLAFLQTVCAYWEDLRWSPAPAKSGDSYHRCDYRILTRRAGKQRGAFSVCLFVSTSSAHLTQRALARNADYARFGVHINGDPVRGQFDTYSLRVSGDLGKTEVEVSGRVAATEEGEEAAALPVPAEAAPPFGSFDDMASFLTRREEWYYAAALPKHGVGLTPVEHAPLTPTPGRLVSAKLTPWSTLELLTPEEQQAPLSVLVEPAVNLTLYPPRLLKREKDKAQVS